MEPCYGCGRPYDDSFADWTMCRECAWAQMQQWEEPPVYMDALGIAWTQSQLDEAGGKHEVDKMVAEADARDLIPTKTDSPTSEDKNT